MKIFVAVIVVVVVAALALAQAQSLGSGVTDPQNAAAIAVQIAQKHNSGQAGTAEITATIDDRTQVVIQLEGEPPGAKEPAYIYAGTCKKLSSTPAYLLTPIVAGTSTTTVDVRLPYLQASRFAVEAFASTSNVSSDVACGNIPVIASASPSTGATNAPTPAPLATYMSAR